MAPSGRNRLKVFPTQSQIERQVRTELPIILNKESQIRTSEGSVVGDWRAVEIFIDGFENRGVVGEVPGTNEGKIRPRAARSGVVIQVQPILPAKLPAHVATDFGQHVAELNLSLADHTWRVFRTIRAETQPSSVGHQLFNLNSRDAKVNVRIRSNLIISPTGEIESTFIQHRSRNITRIDGS